MPKEIKDLKTFLSLCKRADATRVTVKRNRANTKFKIRCSRFLYTLVVQDSRKATKLEQSLPPKLQVQKVERGSRAKAAKKR
ncbi:60S ribosomal protein L38 [Cyanidioschyzon merolae strain 10D]|uniref:Large ribosomal subunit protein eL38 n=1 Tax=Cyanidioschyzon merolae (strain NIES-3377 / 10D) TaxID=280699 RepID=M1V845_CYAM1|nr:60S ribosomal protein L38 [Cyanidioschyzon merolae strain 10D]BAM80294.1 60S ribosomal protein L38 [Cyanidioschyzon merolae strain 10D]|eukprot:XP_005534901.1 60S ribosomal protein L38 [Cyanidioschyzon merolae strain 10D]